MKINYRETERGFAAFFPCPGCGKELATLVKDAGRVTTCKGCGHDTTAPAYRLSTFSRNQVTKNPYSSSQKTANASSAIQRESVFSGISTTTTGLTLVLLGTLMVLCSLASIIVAFFFRSPTFAVGGSVGIIVATLMLMIGPLFCLAVPRKVGATGLIVGSVVCHVIGLLLSFFEPQFESYLVDYGLLDYGQNATGFTGQLLFVFFMQKLAHFIGRDDLVREAKKLVSIAIFCVTWLALTSLFRRVPEQVCIANMIVGIVLFCAYICLPQNRDRVQRRLTAIVTIAFAVVFTVLYPPRFPLDSYEKLQIARFAIVLLFLMVGVAFFTCVENPRKLHSYWIALAVPYFAVSLCANHVGWLGALVLFDAVLSLLLLVVMMMLIQLLWSLVSELRKQKRVVFRPS